MRAVEPGHQGYRSAGRGRVVGRRRERVADDAVESGAAARTGLTVASSRPPELGGQLRHADKAMGRIHPAAAEQGR
jgi:hypothetical protein